MLKEELVDAIKDGFFHVFPIDTIEEGIEVLTGVKAGVRAEDNRYELDSINRLVQDRLNELAEKVKEYSK
jgi:hypothetical protein